MRIKGCCREGHWMSHGLKYQQEGQKLGGIFLTLRMAKHCKRLTGEIVGSSSVEDVGNRNGLNRAMFLSQRYRMSVSETCRDEGGLGLAIRDLEKTASHFRHSPR